MDGEVWVVEMWAKVNWYPIRFELTERLAGDWAEQQCEGVKTRIVKYVRAE